MKVLMTADAVGGVWQYSLDLACGLAQNGADVLLASMGPQPSEEQRRSAATIPRLELVESSYKLEWMQDAWADVDHSTAWLQKLASDFHPDVVHLNGYSQAAARWNWPVVVVAHSCVYSWWRSVHGTAPDSQWDEYKRRVQAGLSACDLVIAPTHAMGKAIEFEYAGVAGKIKVIRNFSRAARCEFGSKQRIALSAGRIWDQAKNLRVLEPAAQRCSWPIEVVGPKRAPQSDEDIESPLNLLGVLAHEDLLARMRTAAVFLHPALYEPFGLSVLEAARARCCLLLSDIPPLRELWDGAALFVDPKDPWAWSRQLELVIRNEALQAELGNRALERSAQYTAFQSVTEYLGMYQELLCKERCAPGVAAA